MSRNEEFENGRSSVERAMAGADRFKDALLHYKAVADSKKPDHDHDYSDSKNNDTCSTCGATNPNDSTQKGD